MLNLNENHVEYAVIITGLIHLISSIFRNELIDKFSKKNILIISLIFIILSYLTFTLFINVNINLIQFYLKFKIIFFF